MKNFIEPLLVKAGDTNLRLGSLMQPPKVDCRVVSEDQYQILYSAYKILASVETKEVIANEKAKRICSCLRSGDCVYEAAMYNQQDNCRHKL